MLSVVIWRLGLASTVKALNPSSPLPSGYGRIESLACTCEHLSLPGVYQPLFHENMPQLGYILEDSRPLASISCACRVNSLKVSWLVRKKKNGNSLKQWPECAHVICQSHCGTNTGKCNCHCTQTASSGILASLWQSGTMLTDLPAPPRQVSWHHCSHKLCRAEVLERQVDTTTRHHTLSHTYVFWALSLSVAVAYKGAWFFDFSTHWNVNRGWSTWIHSGLTAACFDRQIDDKAPTASHGFCTVKYSQSEKKVRTESQIHRSGIADRWLKVKVSGVLFDVKISSDF